MKETDGIAFEVILKDGKPYLRAYHYAGRGKHIDMKIWKAESDKPYCKYLSNYIGLLYLDEDMKKQLRDVLAGRRADADPESGTMSPEEFAERFAGR